MISSPPVKRKIQDNTDHVTTRVHKIEYRSSHFKRPDSSLLHPVKKEHGVIGSVAKRPLYWKKEVDYLPQSFEGTSDLLLKEPDTQKIFRAPKNLSLRNDPVIIVSPNDIVVSELPKNKSIKAYAEKLHNGHEMDILDVVSDIKDGNTQYHLMGDSYKLAAYEIYMKKIKNEKNPLLMVRLIKHN